MSDEEVKAIEIVKDITEKDLLDCWDQGEEEYKSIQILLNLIEKQSKEIEALKLIHESYKEMIEENNFISKDKIKVKIEELEREKDEYEDTPEWELFDYLGGQIEILQLLLEKE